MLLSDLVTPMSRGGCAGEPGEVPESTAMLKEYKSHVRNRAAEHERVIKACAAAFSGSKRAVAKAKAKAVSAKAKAKADDRLSAASKRWANELSKDARAVLLRDRPPDGDAYVCIDQVNGRFLIGYKGFSRKSFSWSLRGESEAVRLALEQLWKWHSAATGAAIPAHFGF